jgi:hypothetical protein
MAFIDCSCPTIKGVTRLGSKTVLRIGKSGRLSISLSVTLLLLFECFLVDVRVDFFVTIYPLSTDMKFGDSKCLCIITFHNQ